MKNKVSPDSIILRYSDSSGVIHEVSLANIMDGGFPIDPEDGSDMEFLYSFVLD